MYLCHTRNGNHNECGINTCTLHVYDETIYMEIYTCIITMETCIDTLALCARDAYTGFSPGEKSRVVEKGARIIY